MHLKQQITTTKEKIIMQNNLLNACHQTKKRANVYNGYSGTNHNPPSSTLYDAYCDYFRPDATSSVSKKADTGKVIIGLTWSENRNLVTHDQIWLQRLLLHPIKPEPNPLHERVLWLLYAVAALVILITL